jgi:hypothetical protein
MEARTIPGRPRKADRDLGHTPLWPTSRNGFVLDLLNHSDNFSM